MKLFSIILGVLLSFSVIAQDELQTEDVEQKTLNDDASLTITASGTCASVVTNTGTSCEECLGKTDCVCSEADKFISWQSSDSRDFKIKFNGERSPFPPGCAKKMDNGIKQCRVKSNVDSGSYTYEVVWAGCENGSDPEIVIK